MRKLLLSACAAAISFWICDAGAMGYAMTMEERKAEMEGHGRVCEALELGTSKEDVKLLKKCVEFPNLERIEIEDEDAWIFRRPRFKDIDAHFFKRPAVISDDAEPKIIDFVDEDEQVFNRRIKSFPKLKKITGIIVDPYRPVVGSLYDFFDEYGDDFDCSMKRILHDITKLQTLEEIDIRGWDLADIGLPESIGDLQNLRVLSIMNCKLHLLPESIGSLKNLRILNLANSTGSELFPCRGFSPASPFCFSPDNTVVLPESIGNLKNLQHLDLRNESWLTSLPESIGNLENLQSLDLSGTYLEPLPESIKKLSKLKKLDLRNNYVLTYIPRFIWEMPALEELMIDKKLEKNIPSRRRRESILRLILTWKNKERWSDDQLKNAIKLRVNGIPLAKC